jgi:hypothetical protein
MHKGKKWLLTHSKTSYRWTIFLTSFKKLLPYQQGDQIGRIFAPWVIDYFGYFLKMAKVGGSHFWAACFHS